MIFRIALQANTLNSVVNFVRAALTALVINHIEAFFANTDAVVIVAMIPTREWYARAIVQSISSFAKTAVGLDVKGAVRWTIQRVVALGVIEDLARIDALALAIDKVLSLRAFLDALVAVVVHIIASSTFASGF